MSNMSKSQRKWLIVWSGLVLLVAGTILLAMQREAPPPAMVGIELPAHVHYEDERFLIRNAGNEPWHDVTLAVMTAGGDRWYTHELRSIEPDETVRVSARTFTDDRDRRFAPEEGARGQLHIQAESDDLGEAWVGAWLDASGDVR